MRAPRPALVTGVLATGVLLAGCSAGASAYETCVEHSVEEGVDRTAAEAACEDVTGD